MTLVYQSYRTKNVPEWIQICMKSVQDWVKTAGYEYRFIDDSLFTYAPDWYREKVNHNIQVVSDLARLALAKMYLGQGYERVVWIDADMLIFNPEMFFLDDREPFYLCRETWIDEDPADNNRIIHQEKINNSISIYNQGNAFLDFYIDACLKIVERESGFECVTVGTTFLTALNELYPLPLLRNVGIISPGLIYHFTKEDIGFAEAYLEKHGSPVYAANLCGSMKGQYFRNMKVDDKNLENVARLLLEEKGIGN